MNILFITLLNIINIDEQNIYSDLARELAKLNNNIYLVSPFEKRYHQQEGLLEDKESKDYHKKIHLLKIKIGNIQKTSIFEKGISTLFFNRKLKSKIIKNFNHIKFDLILYSTPPITHLKTIKYIKNRDNAKTYLLLKDIFPQNAIDLKMLTKRGLKGFIYKYFKSKEKKLYQMSDKIGCMSKANVNYLLKSNPFLRKDKVEEFPNCIEIISFNQNSKKVSTIRKKWNIPLNKTIIISCGNFGKPQDVNYIINCIESSEQIKNFHFVIIGDGTDFPLFKKRKYINATIIDSVNNNECASILNACDIGWITLDYNFTIPNFPSRLLSYMQSKLPIIISSDINTDLGQICVQNQFGWWIPSNNIFDFTNLLNTITINDRITFSKNAYEYLNNAYNVKKVVNKITNISSLK